MASVITTISGLDLHYEVFHPKAEKTVVFLHGFTGSTKTWQHVIERMPENIRIFAIDLIGHGLTASPKNVSSYTMEAQVDLLEAFFEQRKLTNFHLVGYSMGGRTALAYAIAHPERIDRLFLESASPGLENELDREKRKASDNYLAERLLNEGIREFIDYWQQIPLFTTQSRLSEQVKAEIRAERLAQNELGLANSLRGMGTGAQRSYWDSLTAFARPVILLTGELDQKFYRKAEQMKEQFQNCSHIVINGCGHAIHVENPEVFVTMIEKQF